MAQVYDEFQVENRTTIIVNGKSHHVDSRREGQRWLFSVDGGRWQDGNDAHPVTEPQGVGLPPAAVMFVILGTKPYFRHWSAFWRSSGHSATQIKTKE